MDIKIIHIPDKLKFFAEIDDHEFLIPVSFMRKSEVPKMEEFIRNIVTTIREDLIHYYCSPGGVKW